MELLYMNYIWYVNKNLVTNTPISELFLGYFQQV